MIVPTKLIEKKMTKIESETRRKLLTEYPELIALLEKKYEIDQLSRKAAEDAIAYYDAELDLSIANNPDLKNEIARKATKIKTHNESGEYLELSGKLEAAQREERASLIALEQAKREFAVLKLEMKLAIAQKTVYVD
jgi:hemoglobin-like flavoprotein